MYKDRYKESCELAKKNEVTRNKLFILVCILLGLLFLFSYDQNSMLGVIQSCISGNYNCDLMYLVSVYPWENIDEELDELNNS